LPGTIPCDRAPSSKKQQPLLNRRHENSPAQMKKPAADFSARANLHHFDDAIMQVFCPTCQVAS
jgi:hypothetical protein